jgi:hypothetical protein
MELKVEVPFSQLLTLVKTLTPTEKAILRKELDESKQTVNNTNDSFIEFLLKGPVYNEEDIAIIEENRKSIAAWRTKN